MDRCMPESTDPQTELWMVQGADVKSEKLRDVLAKKGIPQVQQVAADTIVLRMTADSAAQLQAEFRELIIELNRALR